MRKPEFRLGQYVKWFREEEPPAYGRIIHVRQSAFDFFYMVQPIDSALPVTVHEFILKPMTNPEIAKARLDE